MSDLYSVIKLCTLNAVISCYIMWWNQWGSNPRSPACRAGVFPIKLWPHSIPVRVARLLTVERRGNYSLFALLPAHCRSLLRIGDRLLMASRNKGVCRNPVFKELSAHDTDQLMVGATGFEPAASWSQTTRATNCATPRNILVGHLGLEPRLDRL